MSAHEPTQRPSRRRWLILALGLLSQAATCSFLYGLPMVVPQLRSHYDLSLGTAGLVVAAPAVGLLLTLIAWGAIADRYGERLVIVAGMAGATVFLVLASRAGSVGGLCVLLLLAGAAAASVNAASGRVVMGWFSRSERGLAMGLRQTAQPLGVGLAALCLPSLARSHGVGVALLLPAVLCGVLAVAVLLLVVDPPRPVAVAGQREVNPYRESTLWRLHASSALLVVPQFAVSGFSMVYLVADRHWDPVAAGRLLFAAQLLGALGRVGSGVVSDRVGSRLGPMRQLAVASAAVMLAVSLGAWVSPALAIAALVVGAVVTVADNGLAFTATAELAGSAWAGRALGAQNTLQNVASSLTPPLLGLLIGAHGFRWGFALVAVFPVAAIGLTPVVAERRRIAALSPASPVPGPDPRGARDRATR